MARSSKRVPFTQKIWKRYDKGISFYVMTGFYFYLIFILTFVFIPDFKKHYSSLFTGIVYFVCLFFEVMSYWCFVKTSITNPGDVDKNYVHPMPNPLDRDKSIMNNEGQQTFNPPTESIYDKILIHFEKYAIQKENRCDLNQTSATDIENPGGFVLPKDYGTKNCIMNNYCYKHCGKCKMDQPPRAKHCDLCKRCVLRYDHHCVVLGNCIGLHNFKYFLLLQLYTFLGGVNLLFWFVYGVKVHGFGSNEFIFFFAQYVFPIFLVGMMSFGCLGQIFVNTYYVVKNRTQMDVMLDFKNNVFDSGSFLTNAKDVLGNPSSKFWWLLPVDVGEKTTDGHNYYFYHYG
ncbi:unnamed protein product [Moneuplotes crassus]|uniref:Palmitoyltransferase n=1 Tax=Euplotes crassus TaxID=5936 RepID=A0AAD2CYF8_EUPCR|nr:unnamed protein product [Moneuplotes crassus]